MNSICGIFYKKDISSVELSKYFNGLSDGSFRLKEYSGFNTYINDLSLGGTTLKNKTDFWWDIKNDMMFWKKNEEFTKDFKSRIIK